MSQVLLLNPRARRKARRKNPSPAQLRARAKFAAMSRARSNPRRRRRNPIAAHPYGGNHAPVVSNPRRRARRRNPALRSYRAAARRRNPIGITGINTGAIMALVKDAAVQGAGAVAMDVAYSYIQKYLPASMQAGPGQVTAGSAVKVLLTAALGKYLSRATGGLSVTAAKGAITVQIRDIVSGYLPAGVMAGGMGYSVPGQIVNRSARIGPNRISGGGRMNGYVSTGSRSPLLSGYTAPGASSPLLSGSARAREGYPR